MIFDPSVFNPNVFNAGVNANPSAVFNPSVFNPYVFNVGVNPNNPLVSSFRVRYPAFNAVPNATVTYWLDEAITIVSAWEPSYEERGALAYAAHKMAEQGLDESLGAGVTSFKSGTFSASVSEAQAKRTGYYSTVYGREFLALARRKFAGPRTAVTPSVAGL